MCPCKAAPADMGTSFTQKDPTRTDAGVVGFAVLLHRCLWGWGQPWGRGGRGEGDAMAILTLCSVFAGTERWQSCLASCPCPRRYFSWVCRDGTGLHAPRPRAVWFRAPGEPRSTSCFCSRGSVCPKSFLKVGQRGALQMLGKGGGSSTLVLIPT